MTDKITEIASLALHAARVSGIQYVAVWLVLSAAFAIPAIVLLMGKDDRELRLAFSTLLGASAFFVFVCGFSLPHIQAALGDPALLIATRVLNLGGSVQ